MTEEELKLRARARLRLQAREAAGNTATVEPPTKASDFGDTESGNTMQFLGGAKHAWDRAAAALQSGAGAIGLPTGESLKPLVESGKKYVEETGPASSLGNFAGEVALTTAPAIKAFQGGKALVKSIPYLRRAGAPTIAGGAAAGATGAAEMGEDVPTGAALGGAMGPLATVAGKVASGTWKGIQNVTGGAAGRATTELKNMFGDRTGAVVEALRNLKGYLPGEAPTAGKAASATFPELKVLEEGARSRPGADRFLQRDAADEAARVAPLDRMIEGGVSVPAVQGGRIPQTPVEASRSNVTRPMYAEAGKQELPLDAKLLALLNGPEVQAAVARGDKSLAQAITNATVGGKVPPAYGTPGKFVPGESLPEWAMGARTPDEMRLPTLSVDVLHRIKSQMDSDIAKTIDPLAKSQLETARNQLNAIMRGGSPDYAAAQQMFKQMSEPQNQADVARVLREKLVTPGGAERDAAFLQATRDAPATVKKAGVPRFESLEQVFSPVQMGEVNAITDSLRREAGYKGLNAPKGIVPEYLSIYDKAEKLTPPLFSQALTTMRKALQQIGQRTDAQTQKLIDDAMLDPRKMAALIDAIPPTERTPAVNALLKSLSGPNVVGAVSGSAGAQ